MEGHLLLAPAPPSAVATEADEALVVRGADASPTVEAGVGTAGEALAQRPRVTAGTGTEPGTTNRVLQSSII